MTITKEEEEALRLHNDARAELKEDPRPSLKWDPGLAAEAEEWAKVLAQRDKGKPHLEHAKQKKHGENLYWGGGDGIHIFAFTFAMAVRSWIEERKFYKGQRVGESSPEGQIGHYTQLIWPACTHVGMGMAMSASKGFYIVARYNAIQHYGELLYDKQKGNIFINRKWQEIKGGAMPKSVVVERIFLRKGDRVPPGFVKVEKKKDDEKKDDKKSGENKKDNKKKT
ncbi:PR-1-like protein [Stipitochalara longipes BDJ]|nr:PR-1-like protein [Stipitochalara longipes BDJ]